MDQPRHLDPRVAVPRLRNDDMNRNLLGVPQRGFDISSDLPVVPQGGINTNSDLSNVPQGGNNNRWTIPRNHKQHVNLSAAVLGTQASSSGFTHYSSGEHIELTPQTTPYVSVNLPTHTHPTPVPRHTSTTGRAARRAARAFQPSINASTATARRQTTPRIQQQGPPEPPQQHPHHDHHHPQNHHKHPSHGSFMTRAWSDNRHNFHDGRSAVLGAHTIFTPFHGQKHGTAPHPLADWPCREEMVYEGDGRIATDRLHRRFPGVPRLTSNPTVNWQQRQFVQPFELDNFWYPLPSEVDIFMRTHTIPDLETTDAEGEAAVGGELMAVLDGPEWPGRQQWDRFARGPLWMR